MQYKVKDSTVI